MTRMQLRPKDSNGPMYSPQRDLAYIYAPAVTEALQALDEANWTPEMRDLLAQMGVTEEMIGLAAKDLSQAHQLLINVDGIDSAHDALTQAGWYNHPASVRSVIYARMGEVIMGGFLIAIRDISRYGEESAQTRQIADLVAAGRMVLERSLQPSVPRDEDKQLKQILSLQAELATCRIALSKARDLEKATYMLAQSTNTRNKELQLHTHDTLGRLDDYSFLERLWWAFTYKRQSGNLLKQKPHGQEESG